MQRAADFTREAGFETEFVGWEKTEALTQIGALEDLGDGHLPRQAQGVALLSRWGRPGERPGLDRGATSRRAELAGAFRFGEDQALVFSGEGFSAGDRVKARRPVEGALPDDGQPHRDPPPAQALQDVLGDHVRQAGSAVRPDKLRFDFTHTQAMSPEERERVEEIVNERMFENLPVHTFLTPIDEARNLGAMMLFGEKYGDVVRVVEVPGFSRELCGGTHVRSTAEIGAFAVLSESSVGSGVRQDRGGDLRRGLRVPARAGRGGRVRCGPTSRRRARRSKRKPEARSGPEVARRAPQPGGRRRGDRHGARGLDPDAMLELSDRLKQQHAPAAVVLGAREDGRVHLVVNLDRSLEERGLDAVALIREAAASWAAEEEGGRRWPAPGAATRRSSQTPWPRRRRR